MHRFFILPNQIEKDTIHIKGEDLKHIKDVLRLKIKDRVEVVSEGIVYLTEVYDITNKEVLLKIVDSRKGKNEPPIDVFLYQGLPKSNKMDFIVQKATEIGVKKIFPVVTSRTVVQIKDRKKEANKVNRWNKICEESAKQSKRDFIPKVNNIIDFKQMIDILRKENCILVPYELEENEGIRNKINNSSNKRINLIIGPEGGFEEEEIEELESIGGKIVSLGPRILRTETAGLVAMTIIMYELGDIGVIE